MFVPASANRRSKRVAILTTRHSSESLLGASALLTSARPQFESAPRDDSSQLVSWLIRRLNRLYSDS